MNTTLPGTEPVCALLTAAYNEEQYIEETIRSVVAQDRRPDIWIIVSDGSTDRTDQIVQRYAREHPFIHFVRREKDHYRRFASKVCALRAGFLTLPLQTIRFIGHLDADVSLEPSYIRDVINKFEEDPQLGIAGGWCVAKRRDELRHSPASNPTWVPGAVQMFRRECYEDIGGLLPIEYGGEDWYAEIRARMCGWRVRSYPELRAIYQRVPGTTGSRLLYCYRDGFADFALGTHPAFELAKLARRLAWPPCLLGALVRLSGFLVAHIVGKRAVPAEFVAFLRKEQLERLRRFGIVLLHPSRYLGHSRS